MIVCHNRFYTKLIFINMKFNKIAQKSNQKIANITVTSPKTIKSTFSMNSKQNLMSKLQDNNSRQNLNSIRIRTQNGEKLYQINPQKFTKLQPIQRSGEHSKGRFVHKKSNNKKQGFETSPQQKNSRLRSFLENNEKLIRVWKEKEDYEKLLFKQKMRIALSPPKNKKSINKQGQLKQSLNKIYLKQLNFFNPSTVNNNSTQKIKIKPLKTTISLRKLKSFEAEHYKNHLQQMISEMQQNRKELLKNKKSIRKRLTEGKTEETSYEEQLLKEMERKFQQHQQNERKQKLERYRQELQYEVEKSLSIEKPKHKKIIQTNEKAEENIIHPKDISSKEKFQQNVEELDGNILPRKNKSMFQLVRQKKAQKQQCNTVSIDKLSALQNEKCIKIIEEYELKPQKQQQNLIKKVSS